ncbi:MAG: hypothetical protein JRJ42_02765 [Deltaproteobacteria bacterium]|nr:hypothetical protein [Deltaproteobacteria bacterium]MBW2018921.1 hypothetical protein [Deltaproteobacteria bacterium]MBW2073136.1 hypothetical protein [Deltaproteobacteria bacterium]
MKRLRLMDDARDNVYAEVLAWVVRQGFDLRGLVWLDVGSRLSRFPAYLSALGLQVFACDRDIVEGGKEIAYFHNHVYPAEFQTSYQYFPACDVRQLRGKAEVVSAIFTLQHDESDSTAYRHCFSLLAEGGVLLIVNEFDLTDRGITRPFYDSNDGNPPRWTLCRRYSRVQILERILEPLGNPEADVKVGTTEGVPYFFTALRKPPMPVPNAFPMGIYRVPVAEVVPHLEVEHDHPD